MKIDLIVRKFEEKGIELSDAQKNAIELLNEYEIDNMNRKSVCPSKIDIKKENWCELRDYIVAAKKEIQEEQKAQKRADALSRALTEAANRPQRIDISVDALDLAEKWFREEFAADKSIDTIKRFEDPIRLQKKIRDSFELNNTVVNQFVNGWPKRYLVLSNEFQDTIEKEELTRYADLEVFECVSQAVISQYTKDPKEINSFRSYMIECKRRWLKLNTYLPTILCLYSVSQGTGKSSFAQAMLEAKRRITGKTGTTLNKAQVMNELRSRFSETETYRGPVIYEELSDLSLNDAETVKSRITSTAEIGIEMKNVQGKVYMQPTATYIMTTNGDPNIIFAKADQSNRRLVTIDCNDTQFRYDTKTYIDDINDLMEILIRVTPTGDENEETFNKWHQWSEEACELSLKNTGKRYDEAIMDMLITLSMKESSQIRQSDFSKIYDETPENGLGALIEIENIGRLGCSQAAQKSAAQIANDIANIALCHNIRIQQSRIQKFLETHPEYFTIHKSNNAGRIKKKLFEDVVEEKNRRKQAPDIEPEQTASDMVLDYTKIVNCIEEKIGRRIACRKR